MSCSRCFKLFTLENVPVILICCKRNICQFCLNAWAYKQSCDFCKENLKHFEKPVKNRAMIGYLEQEMSDIKCLLHIKNPVESYCRICDVYVCVKCMCNEHKQHDFVDIPEINIDYKNDWDSLYIIFAEKVLLLREMCEKRKLMLERTLELEMEDLKDDEVQNREELLGDLENYFDFKNYEQMLFISEQFLGLNVMKKMEEYKSIKSTKGEGLFNKFFDENSSKKTLTYIKEWTQKDDYETLMKELNKIKIKKSQDDGLKLNLVKEDSTEPFENELYDSTKLFKDIEYEEEVYRKLEKKDNDFEYHDQIRKIYLYTDDLNHYLWCKKDRSEEFALKLPDLQHINKFLLFSQRIKDLTCEIYSSKKFFENLKILKNFKNINRLRILARNKIRFESLDELSEILSGLRFLKTFEMASEDCLYGCYGQNFFKKFSCNTIPTVRNLSFEILNVSLSKALLQNMQEILRNAKNIRTLKLITVNDLKKPAITLEILSNLPRFKNYLQVLSINDIDHNQMGYLIDILKDTTYLRVLYLNFYGDMDPYYQNSKLFRCINDLKYIESIDVSFGRKEPKSIDFHKKKYSFLDIDSFRGLFTSNLKEITLSLPHQTLEEFFSSDLMDITEKIKIKKFKLRFNGMCIENDFEKFLIFLSKIESLQFFNLIMDLPQSKIDYFNPIIQDYLDNKKNHIEIRIISYAKTHNAYDRSFSLRL